MDGICQEFIRAQERGDTYVYADIEYVDEVVNAEAAEETDGEGSEEIIVETAEECTDESDDDSDEERSEDDGDKTEDESEDVVIRIPEASEYSFLI